ncbi:tetratricopeptide repeat protein [Streptomyces lavendulae]|uniref:tetratricopeptide repeat protein n=1 Tax=Streptomyces lavendulae TaxID=1914 RepID=UPI0036B6C340
MSTMTDEEIRQGLQQNRGLPYGAARNAQAESLTAAAEASGDPALFRQALITQIDAYEYSAERTRMVVPFARLLQEYDRDPTAFEGGHAHALFWRFKWVAGRIVESPEIPIETVTRWLDDMERRYRIAGYSERAVRQSEFYLAHATGDRERAERAIARWRAADRDAMSDCRACETHTQGWFWADRGEDAKAIEVWEPVLGGDQTCMEEPHRVLARSLLPLVRLGRADEARSHHLRGYRLARGKESLLRSIGEHIEFCALTGNEARGLEILSEHAVHLGPLADVDSQMEFFGGALVLLHRLNRLGHGADLSVRYEGTPRTVDELYGILRGQALAIAARFDARNGSSRVSDELRERIGREPLLDVLPLGVRSAGLPRAVPVTPARAAAPARPEAPGAGLDELVERARTARDSGYPGTDALWAEVAARISALPAPEVDPLVTADVADHQALAAARSGAKEAPQLLADVRDRYRALGRAERVALTELRLATAAAQSGEEPGRVRELLAAALRAAEALDPAEPVRTRRIALAELTSMRVESYLRTVEATRAQDHDHGHDHGHGHGDEHGREVLVAGLEEFVAAYGPDLADLAAEAEETLGRLALSAGDTDRALPLLASAAARVVEADRPWEAVDPLVLRAGVLMSLERPEEAEEAARSALEHAAELVDAEQQGVVRITLADVLLRRGSAAEAAGHALTAAHWFDQADLAADGGAQARLLLARAYAGEGRTADAAEVLQSTLPDLLQHGEGQAVSARDFLGNLLREMRDARGAAEQFLLAAELVQGWEDPRPQAGFAQAAADCLSDAGLAGEAVAAYERALELRRLTGDAVVSEARILRSLAWLGLRKGVTDATTAAARTRMDEAAGVLEAALAQDPEDPELRSELAQTWHQLAQVVDRRVSAEFPDEYDEDDEDDDEDGKGEGDGREGRDGSGTSPARSALGAAGIEALRLEQIGLWERAAALYAALGTAYLPERFQCLNGAAWTDRELGRPTAGAARISALIEEIGALPEGTAPEWLLPQAQRVVTHLTD